jgi:RNA polymerase sigma factor (sigma-70 family)
MVTAGRGAGEASDADEIASSIARPDRFEVILERRGPAVYRYFRRRVGAALAEELTAETFARAFSTRHRFDCRDAASALPWLYGIAGNLVRMHRRTEERRLRAYARAADSGLEPPPSADADRRLDAQRLRPALAAALADLPSTQREVLLLHAWTELSHSEIAAALDIPLATVRTRLHRARASVAERLRLLGNKACNDSVVTLR